MAFVDGAEGVGMSTQAENERKLVDDWLADYECQRYRERASVVSWVVVVGLVGLGFALGALVWS
jgi:hypothetical protein